MWLAGVPIAPVSPRLRIQSVRLNQDRLLSSLRSCRLSWLAARRQGTLAFLVARGAQNKRASVCDGNRLKARCDEGAHHSYRKNRNPDCQLCIDFYFHGRAPWVLGISCSGRPSQVTLVMQAAFQTRGMGRPRAAREFPCKTAGKSGFRPIRARTPAWLGFATQAKMRVHNIYVRCKEPWNGGARSVRVYSLRHGRFG